MTLQRLNRSGLRIRDIADRAKVSTATVDRVLNGRAGVAEATAARVHAAVKSLDEGHAASPRRADAHIALVLPADAGPSTDYLALALAEAGAARGVSVATERCAKLDPGALASALEHLIAGRPDAIVFQALEHPFVRDVVARITASGIPVLTIMSDLQGSGAFGFVGADNRAAGRTAGLLMGRFIRGSGRVAVLWGGTLYRSHEEREIGFRTVMRESFPHLHTMDITGGSDCAEGNRREVAAVLKRYPDLVGIYSVGAGNAGLAHAMEDAGKTQDVVSIVHNLTPLTQRMLMSGVADAVIHQDMDMAAARAVAAIQDRLAGGAPSIARLPVEVIVKENAPTLPAAYAQIDMELAQDGSRAAEAKAA